MADIHKKVDVGGRAVTSLLGEGGHKIIDPIGRYVTRLIEKVFPGAPDPQDIPAPAVEKPETMPTPNDAAMRAAKKKSIAQMRARKGRASTILTQDTAVSDALGG